MPRPANARNPGSAIPADAAGPVTGGRPSPQSAHLRLSQWGVPSGRCPLVAGGNPDRVRYVGSAHEDVHGSKDEGHVEGLHLEEPEEGDLGVGEVLRPHIDTRKHKRQACTSIHKSWVDGVV
eukprot:365338-Chlamydomonas_euryale.AAC.31